MVGRIRGVGARGGHRAFIESALGADTIVAAVAQQNGALLAHRVVGGVDARPVEHHGKGTPLRVAAQRSPVVGLAFGHGRHEAPGDVGQVFAKLGGIVVDAAHQIVLLVGHDPRAGRVAVVPGGGVAVIGGLHGAVIVVTAVDFGVAVVEAATGVVVVAVDHPVLTLGLIVHGCALRVVLTEAHARFDEDTVDFVAHDGHRRHVGHREVVESTHRRAAETAAGHLNQIVVFGRLVVDFGNPAVGVGAEPVLGGGVGVAAGIRDRRVGGLNDADVESLPVRLAEDLVERSVIRGVESAGGAVGGSARGAGRSIDVAGALRPRRGGGCQNGQCEDDGRHGNSRVHILPSQYMSDSGARDVTTGRLPASRPRPRAAVAPRPRGFRG